jgi:hypothetical protein
MIPINTAIVCDSLESLETASTIGKFDKWLSAECFGIEGDKLVKMSTEFHKKYIWRNKP